MKPKLIRITTVPISMNILLKGQLAFMDRHFEVIGVTGRDGKHFEEAGAREGIRMEDIDIKRDISPVNDFVSLYRLYRFIKKEKPAIVHTHTPKAGLLGMLAAWFARVPVRLHTVGGLPLVEVTGPKRTLLNVLEKITYACAHKIYPNSKGLKDIILENNFCSAEKLKVIANGGSNGINVDFFKPDYQEGHEEKRITLRQKHGIKENDLVFGFVGRIAREKGIAELVEVFEELEKDFAIKLALVGVYEKHYGLVDEKTQQSIAANKNIFTLGRFDDVRPLYSMSDVYVFPSYREGFPNSVLEAGAMGLPIIATDINGCNEIVKEDVNGVLIAPKSRAELKQAMLKLCSDKNFRETLAQNARPLIVNNFRREFVWEELLKEYEELLKGKQI